MNAINRGNCYTNGCEYDSYRVPTDGEGNSILTGDGAGIKDDLKRFTLAALETWSVTY